MSKPLEVRLLVEALCEGCMDEKQARRLEDLVRDDPEAAWYYVRCMHLHACLEHDQQGLALDLLAHRPALAMATSMPRRPRWWPLALAASLLIAVIAAGFALLRPHDNPAAQPAAIARLTRAIDCRWFAGESVKGEGANLAAGEWLRLERGLVELTLENGVRLNLVGPILLELASPQAVVLHQGKLTALVPEGAIGFAVRTAGVKVVDLGTEFGVQVQDGVTEVHVFEGQVELESTDAKLDLTGQRLEKGQAVRIDSDRHEAQAVPVQSIGYLREEGPSFPASGIVLSDDFSAVSLDEAKWKFLLPQPRSTARVTAGQVELAGRGYLVTAREYDPMPLGGIRLSGTLTFSRFHNDGQGNFELLDIHTRCSGQPDPGRTHAVTSGIRFRIDSRWQAPVIAAIGPDFRITSNVRVGQLRVTEGDSFRFEIIDTGKNLSYTLTQLDDPANTATATATVSRDTSDTNYIVIHNREGRHTVRLDDLEITTGTDVVRTE